MKQCTWCEQTKPLDSFAFRNKAKGTRRAQCKACIKEWDKRNYQRPEKAAKARESAKRYQSSLKDKIWEYKRNSKCDDCGERNTIVLEFDYLGDKEFNISEGVMRGFSWDKIYKEIKKCDVVCANCHRIRTHERGGWVRNNADMV